MPKLRVAFDPTSRTALLSLALSLPLMGCSSDEGEGQNSDTVISAGDETSSGATGDASSSSGADSSSTGADSSSTDTTDSSSTDTTDSSGTDTADSGTDTSDTGEPPEGFDEDGDGVYPAVPHLIAFGDVHGDGSSTFDVLTAAGIIDDQQNWIAGTTWVVQTGDQLDRGYQEEEIMALFEHLREQAAEAGGRFLALNGNHEVMMTEGRMDYVFDEEAFGGLDARTEAFAPGGPWAQILAKRNIVAKVGGTVFVHGGVLPFFAQEGILTINSDAKDWFLGDNPSQPDSIDGSGSVVWDRTYSEDELPEQEVCAIVDQALALMDADRIVVAHTVQDNINSICNGKIWRIDTGMSAYYGGVIEALEITDDSEISVIVGN